MELFGLIVAQIWPKDGEAEVIQTDMTDAR
jgi:hypothetical protein